MAGQLAAAGSDVVLRRSDHRAQVAPVALAQLNSSGPIKLAARRELTDRACWAILGDRIERSPLRSPDGRGGPPCDRSTDSSTERDTVRFLLSRITVAEIAHDFDASTTRQARRGRPEKRVPPPASSASCVRATASARACG